MTRAEYQRISRFVRGYKAPRHPLPYENRDAQRDLYDARIALGHYRGSDMGRLLQRQRERRRRVERAVFVRRHDRKAAVRAAALNTSGMTHMQAVMAKLAITWGGA